MAKNFSVNSRFFLSHLKLVAKKYAKGMRHSQKKDISDIQQNSIFFILFSLWPGLKPQFVNVLIKNKICSVNNQIIGDPFFLVSPLSIIKVHQSPVSFIVLSMIFLSIKILINFVVN